MTDPNASRETVADEHLEVVDLFRTAWVKAFIRANHAEELETVEILLSLGQQLITRVPARRADHARLDLVLAAMLRPALLAAKAAYENLREGLYEPGLAQARTLLELDLSLDYMLADAATKDLRADRYLAWAYKKRIGPLEEQLKAPELRALLDPERVAWIEGRLAVCRANLAALPEATTQNQADHSWHAHRNVKGLARHLRRLDDYVQIYAPLSGMTVHAADPESHLNITDDDKVTIKPLANTEPHAVATATKLLAGFLQTFLSRFRDEWGVRDTPLGLALVAASMRFVGRGDGRIPAELRPDDWATAIRVTQAPLAEILEEAVQLVLVLVARASDGLTEAELHSMTGLDAIQLGERGHALLHILLDHLVEVGALRLDATQEPHRFRAPAPEGNAPPRQ